MNRSQTITLTLAVASAVTLGLQLSRPAQAEPTGDTGVAELMSSYGIGPRAARAVRTLDWWETRDRAAVSDDKFLELVTLYNGFDDHEREVLALECVSFAVQWMADGPSTPAQLAAVELVVRDVLADNLADVDSVFAAAHAARMLGLEHDGQIAARLIYHQQRFLGDNEFNAWIREILVGVDSPFRR